MATQQDAMSVSDFNLDRLNTKELSDHLAATLAVGSNIAIFGRRGTGKTEISKYEIAKSNMYEVYVNLSVMERVDLGGYPDFSKVSADEKRERFISYLLPRFYQAMFDKDVLAGKKGVVILFDEVDKAEPSLWAPLLELVQFKSINGRKLDFLHAVIMTGNLISEGGQRPSPPLLDRCEAYLIQADATLWLDWAGRSRRIHPAVAAFIHDNPNSLFGAIDPEDRYKDPSPRGWDNASQLLFAGERLGWSKEMLIKKVRGCVGKEAGIRYAQYYEYYQDLLPMVEDIFKGNDVSEKYNSLEPGQQLIAAMITCARLANQMDQNQEGGLPESVRHIGKFLQIVSYENVLVAVRSQITIDRIVKYNLDEQSEWRDLLSKINKKVNNKVAA